MGRGAVKDADTSAPNRFLSANGCGIEAHAREHNGFVRRLHTCNPP